MKDKLPNAEGVFDKYSKHIFLNEENKYLEFLDESIFTEAVHEYAKRVLDVVADNVSSKCWEDTMIKEEILRFKELLK